MAEHQQYHHDQSQATSPAPNITPVPSTTPIKFGNNKTDSALFSSTLDSTLVNLDPVKAFMNNDPTPLQKHVMFFDRNKDGILTPFETFEGFRILGYGYFLSIFGTIAIHLAFSYITLDSWIPDPFFTIYIKNIHRTIHGSDTGIYDNDGSVKEWRLREIFQKFANSIEATSGTGRIGLSFADGWRLTESARDLYDPIGWISAKLEWFFLYVLVAKDGIVTKDDIQAVYDGSLFERIEEERKNQSHFHSC